MPPLLNALGFIALLAYLLAVPVMLAAIQGWSGYDLARLLQWPLMLLATAAVAWRPGGCWTWGVEREHPPRRRVEGQEEGEEAAAVSRWPIIHRVAGGAMFALALLAVWRAPVPAMALRELALACGCLALASLVSRAASQQAGVLRAALAGAGGYALLITGLALLITVAGEEVSRPDLFTGYDNHRYYSHVLTAALPLALAAQLTLPGRLWRAFSAVSLALLGMMVFATGGRGTLLALVVAAAVVAATVGRRGWPAIRALALGLTAGLLGFLLLFVWPAPTDPAAASALADYSSARLASDQGRLPLWQHAIDMTLASPWWGSGPMHFAHGARLAGAHPHNLPLQIAAEWGLPMLALVCLFIGAVLHRAWQRLRTAEGASGLGVALCIGVLAVLLDSLVSGNVVMPVSQVWIAVLVGLFWAWLFPAAAPPASAQPLPLRRGGWVWAMRLLGLAAVLLQLWLGLQMLPEAAHIGEHIDAATRAFPTERQQPRFWSHGLF